MVALYLIYIWVIQQNFNKQGDTGPFLIFLYFVCSNIYRNFAKIHQRKNSFINIFFITGDKDCDFARFYKIQRFIKSWIFFEQTEMNKNFKKIWKSIYRFRLDHAIVGNLFVLWKDWILQNYIFRNPIYITFPIILFNFFFPEVYFAFWRYVKYCEINIFWKLRFLSYKII